MLNSLVDPFFVNSIVFHQHLSMAYRDAFGGFTFAAFDAKNIPVVVAIMISRSLIESSMFFFQSKLLIYCIGSSSDLKHMSYFWFNRLFMDDLPCLLVVRKKYANTYGKDSKYAK